MGWCSLCCCARAIHRPSSAGKGHFFQTSGVDNSFPSGHTILTWTAASTVAHEYPKPWVEWLTHGTAVVVSVTRFTSLQHFPSDMVVGSALGYLVGRHIYFIVTVTPASARHARKNEKSIREEHVTDCGETINCDKVALK